MTSSEYLSALRAALQQGGMSGAEINRVIAEYDAKLRHSGGAGVEELVMQRLGSPEQAAQDILRGRGTRSSQGPRDFDPLDLGPGEPIPEDPGDQGVIYHYDPARSAAAREKTDQSRKIITAVVLLATMPMWIQLLIGVLVVLGIVLVLSLLAVVLTLVGGVILVVAGFFTLLKASSIALCLLGGGMILWGLFGLVVLPLVKGLLKLFGLMGKGFMKLFHKIFI